MGLPYTENIVALNAVTASVANTSAPPIDVSKRQKLSIQFIASGIVAGSGAFGIEVSNDGVNWVVYNRLINNLVETNTQSDAKSAAPTFNVGTGNGTSMYFFPDDDYFRYVRVFVTVVTDGTYSAVLQGAG